MKKNWKKYLTSGLVLSASTVLLAACAGGGGASSAAPDEKASGSSATEEVKVEGKVKVWIDTEHVETF